MGDYCVYKHTSPNGKVYIGITCRKDPEIRWNKGYGYSNNLHFVNAIKKYGWDNFRHEVLQRDLTHDEANRIEAELISQHNSADQSFGYNVSPGGGAWADETRLKSAASIKRAWADPQRRIRWVQSIRRSQNTDECRDVHSKISTLNWQNAEFRSKTITAVRANANSDEGRAWRTKAVQRMWADPEKRAKLCAAIKAAKSTPDSRARTSKQWKGRVDSEVTRKLRSESIRKHFESPDAKKRLCDGIRKGWEAPLAKQRHADGLAKYWQNRTKRVMCVETGEVYASVSAARKATGGNEGIRNCCSKCSGNRTSGGYHWKWADEMEGGGV
ncbi:MAG: GIY-YIG nuclease family protein [Christensenellales bacterium]